MADRRRNFDAVIFSERHRWQVGPGSSDDAVQREGFSYDVSGVVYVILSYLIYICIQTAYTRDIVTVTFCPRHVRDKLCGFLCVTSCKLNHYH